MEAQYLIPSPDTIPAHWLLFELLEHLTFTLHILLVNIVLGGSLIAMWTQLFTREHTLNCAVGSIKGKIPATLAMAITLGIAPLLFIQVTYGHLFYTSSIIMAVWWIMIIPLLIIGYYCSYAQRQVESNTINGILTVVMSLVFLYIAFMLTNNNTLMLQPGEWTKYFANKSGTLLNLNDPTLIPRYLHFVTASIAVGGLFSALVWSMRADRGAVGANRNAGKGLKIFAYGTALQIATGFWFLFSLPQDIRWEFIGGDMPRTIIMTLGILLGIASLIFALRRKMKMTIIHLLLTVVLMVISRAQLRYSYIREFFSYEQLELKLQITPLIFFLAVFVIGLILIYYMLNSVRKIENGRT